MIKLSFNSDMPRPRLPHLHKQTTRHGKIVWYVRIGHGPRIRIHPDFGTADFQKEYQAAISGTPTHSSKKTGKDSLQWLIERYRLSAEWELASKGTRRQRDHFYHGMIQASGGVPYQAIKKQHILDGIDRRKKTPGAANNFLKSAHALFRWATESDYIDTDPTEGIKKLKYKSIGFPAWSSDDVDKFRAHWKIGTRERLAMEILWWTGLRRGDVVRLGKQHIKDGIAMLPTEKTNELVFLTITPELRRIIDASPTGDLAFIATEQGKPRNKEAFGNWFGATCRKVGISKNAHGLRKLAATIVAEAGGTHSELQAAFGWKTEAMARLYTEKADKKHLSKRASEKRLSGQNPTSIPSPASLVRDSSKKHQ